MGPCNCIYACTGQCDRFNNSTTFVATALRGQVRKARQRYNPLPSGTVIKFNYDGSTYAALSMNGKWYVTGNVLLGRNGPYTHDRMVDILAASSDIRLASEWETV